MSPNRGSGSWPSIVGCSPRLRDRGDQRCSPSFLLTPELRMKREGGAGVQGEVTRTCCLYSAVPCRLGVDIGRPRGAEGTGERTVPTPRRAMTSAAVVGSRDLRRKCAQFTLQYPPARLPQEPHLGSVLGAGANSRTFSTIPRPLGAGPCPRTSLASLVGWGH